MNLPRVTQHADDGVGIQIQSLCVTESKSRKLSKIVLLSGKLG